MRHGVLVTDFPIDDGDARERAKAILDELQPGAIIATEKMGPNQKGVIHGGWGADITPWSAKVHHLVDEANARGILTIGVSDLGNEIGAGVIEDAVREIVPFGNKCTCPCGGGIATRTKTEVLIISSTCNWGAYGIEACLAAVLGRPDLIHTAALERQILEAARAAGLFGDVKGLLELAVDTIPGEVHVAALEMMRAVVKSGFREAPPWILKEMKGTIAKS